jgi:uncharacterized protein YbjQ (UPF0145 family)
MRTIAFFLLICFLPGCIGYNVVEDFTQLEKVDCKVYPEEVFLFFLGETTDFKYQKVGTINLTGTTSTTREELLSRLKSNASDHCANAIIGIQVSNMNRQLGIVNDDSPYNYMANTVSGLAVRIERDSAFNAKYGKMAKTDFRSKAQNSREKEESENMSAMVLGGILVLGALIFVVIMAESQE